MATQSPSLVLPLLFLSVSSIAAESTDPVESAVAQLGRCSDDSECPSGTPPEFVRTPGGWFHPSCVVAVENGGTYDMANGETSDALGKRKRATPCGYQAYDLFGVPLDEAGSRNSTGGAAPSVPAGSDWIASVKNTTIQSSPAPRVVGKVSYISSRWVVPSTPVSGGGTFYFFPGLQNYQIILQPVLAYNGNNGSGGKTNGWSINSWACCDYSDPAHPRNILFGSPISVAAGRSIYGEVSGTNCNPTTGWCDWTITTRDNNTGATSSGTATGIQQSFGTGKSQVVAGALEVDPANMTQCSRHSASLSINLFETQVRDINGLSVLPENVYWQSETLVSSPDCRPTASWLINNTIRTNTILGWWPSNIPKPNPPTSCGRLLSNEGLIAGQSLYSCDGRFRLTVQSFDGNLVLYQGSTALWADNKYGGAVNRPATMVVLGGDGNFRHYTPTAAVWESGPKSNGATLYVQNDGNVVIYRANGSVLWATNTCCH